MKIGEENPNTESMSVEELSGMIISGLEAAGVPDEVLGHIGDAFSGAADVGDLQLILQSIAYFVHEGEDGMKKAQFMMVMQKIVMGMGEEFADQDPSQIDP